MWAGHDEIRLRYVGDDDHAYGRILLEAWECWGDDLAIVEPDIVIDRSVVAGFHSCPEPYCCYPYAMTTNIMPALGCTRFSLPFREQYPNAVREALELPGGYGAGHFRSVDVCLQRYVLAREYGIQPHVHLPAVTHLNEKQALRPDAPREVVMEVPLW